MKYVDSLANLNWRTDSISESTQKSAKSPKVYSSKQIESPSGKSEMLFNVCKWFQIGYKRPAAMLRCNCLLKHDDR